MAASFDHEVCKPFYHKGSDNGILLLNGFTGCAAHMRPLAEQLAGLGYTVRTINLPGHATSEEDMAKSDWQQWLHSAKEAAFGQLVERLSQSVPLWKMACTKDPQAAVIAYEAMKG